MPRRNVPCKARPEALLLGGLATHSLLSVSPRPIHVDVDAQPAASPSDRIPGRLSSAHRADRTDGSGSRSVREQRCSSESQLRLFEFERRQNKHTTRPPHPCPLDDDDVNHPSVRYTPAEHERRAERARTVHAFGATPVKTSRTQEHRTQEHRTTTCA